MCLVQVQGLAASGALQGAAMPSKLSLHQAFSQIIRQEGLKALWKGNGVTIVHRLPYSAVNFWAYERSTELWTLRYPPSRDKPAQDVIRRLVCGGFAGMLACTVVRHHKGVAWGIVKGHVVW
jgi:solute carrier family 25 phosphate transporter 23/24/25/41